MAEKRRGINFPLLNRLAGRVQDNIDDMYQKTYYSTPENKDQLQVLKKDISDSIKSIMDNNAGNTGESNISKLYERLLNIQRDGETSKEFAEIFGDNEFINNLTMSYLDNRWVSVLDNEIDEVLKYMPKLQEALLTIRDNVLSADSFSKDYLNLESKFGVSDKDKYQFSRNVDDMKDKYNLLDFTVELYDDISKYGEVFVYVVPYDKAIQKLMNRKRNNTGNISIKTNIKESNVIIESYDGDSDILSLPKGYSFEEDGGYSLNLDLEVGVISSLVEQEKLTRDKLVKLNEQSLKEQYLNEVALLEASTSLDKKNNFDNTMDHDLEMNGKLPVHHQFDQTLDDNLQLPNGLESNSADGLVATNVQNRKISKMNGCIVKKLKRDRVTPIMINDVCLGYYYWELDSNINTFGSNAYNPSGMMNTLSGVMSISRSNDIDAMARREEMLRSIASSLAVKIDHSFVNANTDLKKEIYHILKYNDDLSNSLTSGSNGIRVSYVPPEDIHHLYFKLDKDTNRGVSDLAMSLIPAKLWVAIYITNCLAIMTRGNDKRIYYVKQSVETNISKTLLKTISEIKKSNFGMRQVESINSILNITGRFNDHIIPRGSDGQSPVEFEVMQGQQIEIKTDLLNILEESAINVIGVPIEIIQNRQSPDYAIQFTMSNSKFLRFVYSRQSQFQRVMEGLLTAIYNIEYSNTDTIKVTLPPPLFINVTNTNQLIVNTNDYCENISGIFMADEDDAIKQSFVKKLKIYNLGSYLKMDVIERLINEAKQETVKNAVSRSGQGEE